MTSKHSLTDKEVSHTSWRMPVQLQWTMQVGVGRKNAARAAFGLHAAIKEPHPKERTSASDVKEARHTKGREAEAQGSKAKEAQSMSPACPSKKTARWSPGCREVQCVLACGLKKGDRHPTITIEADVGASPAHLCTLA